MFVLDLRSYQQSLFTIFFWSHAFYRFPFHFSIPTLFINKEGIAGLNKMDSAVWKYFISVLVAHDAQCRLLVLLQPLQLFRKVLQRHGCVQLVFIMTFWMQLWHDSPTLSGMVKSKSQNFVLTAMDRAEGAGIDDNIKWFVSIGEPRWVDRKTEKATKG